MIIACPACGTRYAVPDSAIGLEGRTVRCAKCRHSWFQDGPEITPVAPAGEPAAAATISEPAPAPVPADAPVSAAAPAPAPAPAPPHRPAIVTPPRERAPEDVPPDVSAAHGDDPLPPAPPPPAPRRADRSAAAYYDDTRSASYADERASRFDHAPPFRRRRNWTRIATWAAGVFAVVALGVAGAVAWGGLPDWVPIPRATFQQAQPDLKLDFPRNRQDRKPLPDGTQFFSVSGTISNIGAEGRHVPSLLVVLRDRRETIVYEKEIVPSRDQLAPGETITVNEALTDIPKSAASAEIGWKPE